MFIKGRLILSTITLMVVVALKSFGQCPGSALNITLLTNNSSCANNGSITVNASGGVSPYIYEIISGPVMAPAQSSNVFNALPTGTYTVRLADDCGNTIQDNIFVDGAYNQIEGQVQQQKVKCPGGSDGELSIFINGGSTPFTYELIAPSPVLAPAQSSNVFTGLSAGYYSVKINDGCGNFITEVFVLEEQITSIPEIQSNYYAFPEKYACDSMHYDIILRTKPFPLVDPLTYEIVSGQVLAPPQLGTDFYVPQGGDYGFKVTDGCGRSHTTTISSDPLIQASSSDSCGVLGLSVTLVLNMKAPLTYEIISGPQLVGPQSSPNFPGLPAGTYTVQVTDDCGLVKTKVVTLSSSLFYMTYYFQTPSCDTPKVNVRLSFNGGTPPITVTSISGPTNINTTDYWLNNILPGHYVVVGEDACGQKDTIAFDATESYFAQVQYDVELTCSGANLANLDIISNTTPGWNYVQYFALVDGPLILPEQEIDYVNNLNAGTYVLRSRVQNCYNLYHYDTIVIEPYQNPQLSVSGAFCSAGNTGQINCIGNLGYTPYQYEIISGPVNVPLQSSPTFNSLPPGVYDVRMVDSCNNSNVKTIQLLEFGLESIHVSSACEGGVYSMQVDTVAGASFSWTGPSGFSQNHRNVVIQPFTSLDTGLYTLDVFLNACIDTTIELRVGFQNPIADFLYDDFCLGFNSGPVLFGDTGGVFTFISAPGDGATIDSLSGIISNATAGQTYSVQYTVGENGCNDSSAATPTVLISGNAQIDTIPSVCQADSIILLGASHGGLWSASCGNCISDSGAFNPVVSGAGVFEIIFTPTSNCIVADTASITVSALDTATIIPPGNLCSADSGIQLIANPSIGQWEASCGACISTTGFFEPSLAPAGVSQIWQINNNPCFINDTAFIEVLVDPDASIQGVGPLCKTLDSIQLFAVDSGGVWSASCGNCIDQNGVFFPSVSDTGIFTVEYIIPGVCSDTGLTTIEVVGDLTVQIDSVTPVCSLTPAFQVQVNVAGGLWSASCGVCLDSMGVFDPSVAGGGNHQIMYSINSLCGVGTDTFTLDILVDPDASIDPVPELCLADNPVQLITQDPAGVWTSSCGNCLSSTGLFDPTIAGVGLHNINYSIVGLCGDAGSINITVGNQSNASFNPDTMVCITEMSLDLHPNFSGGIWSDDCNGCVDANGIFNVALAGEGVWQVQYNIGGNSTCADSASHSIYVMSVDTPSLSFPKKTCINNDPFLLQSSSILGVFSASCGSCVSTGNYFDPSIAGAGTHQVYYAQVGTCTYLDTLTIEVVDFQLQASLQHPLCFGNNNGRIGVQFLPNLPDSISYNWTGFSLQQNGNNFDSLDQGVFTLQRIYFDSMACLVDTTFDIVAPAPLVLTINKVNPTCNGLCNGNVILSGSGGVGTYTYAWQNGGTLPNQTNLCAGQYQVSFTDGNACLVDSSFQLIQPSGFVFIDSVSPEHCFLMDGEIAIKNLSGGISPYSIVMAYLDSSGNTISLSVDTVIENLGSNNYQITISDQNACDTVFNGQVNHLDAPIVSTQGNMVSCNGVCDGLIFINLQSSSSPVQYHWSGGLLGDTIDQLCVGEYIGYATDDYGCVGADTTSITEPDLLEVNILGSDSSCAHDTLVLDLNYSGGNSGTPLVTWDDGTTANQLIINNYQNQGCFSVEIADSMNCKAYDTLCITLPDPLGLLLEAPVEVCPGDEFVLTATVGGGYGDVVTIDWGNYTGVDTTLTQQANGNFPEIISYTVVAQDGCALPDTGAIIVSYFPPIVGNFVLNDTLFCAGEDMTLAYDFNNLVSNCELSFGDGDTLLNCAATEHLYEQEGSYTIAFSGNDNNGCVFAMDTSIHVIPFPIAGFDLNSTELDLMNPVVSPVNTSSYHTDSEWSFYDHSWNLLAYDSGDSVGMDYNFYLNHENYQSDTGWYPIQLVVFNQKGCSSDTVKYIHIKGIHSFFVPNAFTVNNDNLNDGFKPIGLGVLNNDYYLFQIFDRWGDLVFQSNDFNEYWNGHLNNDKSNPLSKQEVYNWRVKYQDIFNEKHVKVGPVFLLGSDQ